MWEQVAPGAAVEPGGLGGFCNMSTTNVGCLPGSGSEDPFYSGRYPSANMYYNGTWMIGTYGLGGFGAACTKTCSPTEAAANPCPATNYLIQGPFFGWHTSTDEGRCAFDYDTMHSLSHRHLIRSPISQEFCSDLICARTTRSSPEIEHMPHHIMCV